MEANDLFYKRSPSAPEKAIKICRAPKFPSGTRLRKWLRNPAPPHQRVTTRALKNEMNAKMFSLLGPRPTDFLYSARTVESREA